jgi:hypothetical protein
MRNGLGAGAVALAIALGVLAFGPHYRGDARTGVSAPTQANLADFGELRRAVLTRLGMLDVPGQWRGLWAWDVYGDPAHHTFGAGAPWPAGTYDGLVTCAGRGSITVTWWTSDTPITLTVPCSSKTDLAHFTAYLPTPGEISLIAQGDALATGQAAFGVLMTDPYIVAAKNALGPGSFIAATSGDTSEPRQTVVEGTQPGTYRVSLVCVGTDTLQVSFMLGDAHTRDDVVCTDGGARLDLQLTSSTVAASVVTIVTADGEFTGSAGYAYGISQVP